MMTTDKSGTGLYIHVPFCRSKCPYCDFYSLRADEETIDRYVKKICSDIRNCGIKFDTVYFGGGTPSFIGAERIAEMLSSADFEEGSEITVECNPSDTGAADKDFDFRLLRRYGVNRISMGLQSAIEEERKQLGRKAGCTEILRAVDRAQESGIDNISLDVMLGVPGQTDESLIKSLDFCLSAGAKHISTYMLKIEEGTFFFRNRERYNFPDDDKAADFYLLTSGRLKEAGMKHYEISNFAFDGYESIHNLKYWKCNDYLGLGPAAHSFINGRRFYYGRSIDDYISGVSPVDDGEGGDEEEFIMLSLRLSEGISFERFSEKFRRNLPSGFIDKCREFEKMRLGILGKNSFSLTDEGFLVSNSIICELCEVL